MPSDNSFNIQIPGYRLIRILGTGGMGTVYEAVRQNDGERFAVKVCHPHLATLKEFHKRFQREASLALKFQHPGAAAIYDNGVTENGVPYIIMELVEGRKLSDMLPVHADSGRIAEAGKSPAASAPPAEQPAPLPIEQAMSIARRIAETLGEAHKTGLFHRDIKPDNIIIQADGNVKILDFGLVKDEASLSTVLTQTGRGLGTPAYMSPEQCQGDKKIDGRTDLYSLGVVLYEMATGEQPFKGPTTAAYTRQHIEDIPERAFKRNPRVPENLSLVIDRLLAKKPEDRYQSAEELINDLERINAGKPPLKIYRFKKPRRISPVLIVAGIALAFVILGAGGWFAYGRYQMAKTLTELELALTNAERYAGAGDYIGAVNELQHIKLKNPDHPELMDEVNKMIAQYNSGAAEQKRRQDEETKKREEEAQLAEEKRKQEEAVRLAKIEEEKHQAEIEREKREEERLAQEAEEKKRRFESALAEAKSAEERNDLRAQVAALEAALLYQSDPLTQSRANRLRPHLDQYNSLIKEGRAALGSPMTFEKAVESFEQAKKIWNTTEATDLLAQAKQSIANRKHRLAVIDFAISGDVNMRDAGVSVAGLLQADAMLASRFEIIERRQLQKMLEEIKLQMSDLVGDNEKAAEFGRIKGVPYILTGQVIKLGKLSVTAYILEVQSGRQIAQAKVSADDAHSLEAKLPDLSRILCMTPEELKEYEAQQPGQVFIEDLGGGVNLEMGWIPAGSFEMGSPDSEAGRYKQEGPVHTVSLDGFWMGKYEVTQEQYEAVMGTNPSKFKGAKNPVENVSWGDAMAFCKKLSLKTGKNFTLPSEAQWEYACRAGTRTPFYFGNTISTNQANYHGNYTYGNGSKGVYRVKTIEVGSFAPNAFGLYDMHGNVWEWCLDWYDEKFYGKAATREQNPVNNNQGDYRVLRGGSWVSIPGICRSAYRGRCYPTSRSDGGGFRVVSFPP